MTVVKCIIKRIDYAIERSMVNDQSPTGRGLRNQFHLCANPVNLIHADDRKV